MHCSLEKTMTRIDTAISIISISMIIFIAGRRRSERVMWKFKLQNAKLQPAQVQWKSY